jgi:hypothetical protein
VLRVFSSGRAPVAAQPTINMPSNAIEKIRIIFFSSNVIPPRDCHSQPLVGNHGVGLAEIPSAA